MAERRPGPGIPDAGRSHPPLVTTCALATLSTLCPACHASSGAGRQVLLDRAPAQRPGRLPDAHGALGGRRGGAAAGARAHEQTSRGCHRRMHQPLPQLCGRSCCWASCPLHCRALAPPADPIALHYGRPPPCSLLLRRLRRTQRMQTRWPTWWPAPCTRASPPRATCPSSSWRPPRTPSSSAPRRGRPRLTAQPPR